MAGDPAVVTADVRVHRVVDGIGIWHLPEREVPIEALPDLLEAHAVLPGRVTMITVVVDRDAPRA